MTARTAAPLPECSLCEAPTRRDVHEANGGLCSGCVRGIADTVRMLPPGKVVDIDRARRLLRASQRPPMTTDQTVFVERYTPPVPGQTQLPLEDS